MIDLSDTESRYILTPNGKAWMFGFDGVDTVTVHFDPQDGEKLGRSKCYKVEDCEELHAN